MSDAKSNLLIGTSGATVTNKRYDVVQYQTTEPLVVGKKYTISAYVEKLERLPLDGSKHGKPELEVYDGGGWCSFDALAGDVPGPMTLTFTYKQPFKDHADPNKIILYNTPPNGTGVTRMASIRNVMLVEGDTPAAWAPAEGETLAGGVLS